VFSVFESGPLSPITTPVNIPFVIIRTGIDLVLADIIFFIISVVFSNQYDICCSHEQIENRLLLSMMHEKFGQLSRVISLVLVNILCTIFTVVVAAAAALVVAVAVVGPCLNCFLK